MQDRPEVWPAERLSVTDALWGDGLKNSRRRVGNPAPRPAAGLSAASSLLLIGAGSGGAPCCVASHLGVWVTGFETNFDLAALGNERSIRTGLGRRAQIESWDPHAPEFGRSYFHHALALDPLRDGNHESVLAAATVALKPGGQITVVDNAADTPLDLADPDVRAWTRRASREPDSVPTQANVTRILTRLGFDVRIVEDVSHRHVQQALFGWRQVVGDLEDLKPTARQAMPLVREAGCGCFSCGCSAVTRCAGCAGTRSAAAVCDRARPATDGPNERRSPQLDRIGLATVCTLCQQLVTTGPL